ncbi:MAG: UDP-N-acetylglucosamine 2-epimerase (non-hydrolyzing) [Candidatus Omnitrophica bacterium]|nr:UDP-N-acetylglucosamine 2-epimerase (non-hydrolyzing) [Candidatus Omnitrophota bacterium]
MADRGKIISIVGARPQFIKLAPLVRAFREKAPKVEHVIVHTGQHYDYNMSKVFFEELGLPEPDFHLGVGSAEHGLQTALMLRKIEEVFLLNKPDRVIVYGDTNSTLAGALAAAKLHIPVDHVEAGLRSYDRTMPEEINRALTDHCSSILFCPTENAVNNLSKEGFSNIVNGGKLVEDTPRLTGKEPFVLNVGDIMYDSFLLCLGIAEKKSRIIEELSLKGEEYCLATVHRAENTDDETRLRNILEALNAIGKDTQVVFPMHPRTRKCLEKYDIRQRDLQGIRMIDPVSYFDMLILEKNAKVILTDSGGMQKEAYFAGVPCITLREETEWIETVEAGWNFLVGADKSRINAAFQSGPSCQGEAGYGIGLTSTRIIEIIAHPNRDSNSLQS